MTIRGLAWTVAIVGLLNYNLLVILRRARASAVPGVERREAIIFATFNLLIPAFIASGYLASRRFPILRGSMRATAIQSSFTIVCMSIATALMTPDWKLQNFRPAILGVGVGLGVLFTAWGGIASIRQIGRQRQDRR